MLFMVLLVPVIAIALWLFGWFGQPQAWEQATGWDRIPIDQRPDSGPLLADHLP